jgi:ornithine cyclodeaminase
VRILSLAEIRPLLDPAAILDRMREALLANSRGECDTPMPMHLDIAPESAEVHMKSSYRRGGKYFCLKIASTFPNNRARGLSTSAGMMLLSSAETGAPVALLNDEGHLTDFRTAAIAAMIARELGRRDEVLGIVGTGIQARLQAQLHAAILPLRRIVLWGRNPERAAECARDLAGLAEVSVVNQPGDVARFARLIVTATASRAPLLRAADVQPGTHISAVGSDGAGKQELDPEILRAADLLLADSKRQCLHLGELQHAPDQMERAVEFTGQGLDGGSLSVADFTGLGAEDLYIAEWVYERSLLENPAV